MFNVGEYIVYGKRGVCSVQNIGHLKLPGIDENRLYYTLVPVYTTETIFAPVDTGVFMRPVITKEQAMELIAKIPTIEESLEIPLETNSKEMPDYYKSLLTTHDCSDLIRLIVTVYSRSQIASEHNKKLCQTDQNYMRDAEDILYGELSVALGIPKEEMPGFIRSTLENMQKIG